MVSERRSQLPPPGGGGAALSRAQHWARHGVVGSLVVALAYAVSGHLGLALAVPPGYATAVWPASGIALAYLLVFGLRHWPGVLVGSLLVNGPNAVAAGAPWIEQWPVLLIAIGAAIQSVAGVLLTDLAARRKPGPRDERRVILTLLLGGPVACLISATIGVSVLSLSGAIPDGGFWVNWGNWWVGDTIGVLVFTPVLLIWLGRDEGSWRRRLTATVPLLLMFVIVVWLFFFTSQREQERVRIEFVSAASAIADRFRGELEHDRLLVESLAAYFDSGLPITREQFRRYATDLLALRSGVKSLQWVREVTPDQREAYIAERRAEGYENFEIRGLLDGQLQPLPPSSERSSVITYLEPWEGNEAAFGFDIRTNPTVALTLPRAIGAGEPAVSGRIRLVQETGDAYAVVLYHPLYAGGVVPSVSALRELKHIGFVSGVLRLPNLLAGPLQMPMGEDMRVRLVDLEADPELQLMFESRSPVSGAADGFHHIEQLSFGQRRWQMEFALPAAYLLTHRSWQAWSLLAVGLLLTSLLGLLILILSGRNERVQQMVSERTRSLTEANQTLLEREGAMERLVGELRASEQQLLRATSDLEASNRELEQFAYVASHDLKAPLRTVASFTQLLERRLGAELDADASEYLDYIRRGVHNMHALTDDLLSISRIGKAALNREPVSLKSVVEQARDSLTADIEACGARLQIDTLPTVEGDAGMLVQVFQNLIGNAIKFQPVGRKPVVQVRCEGQRDGWHVEVVDNGIGMDTEHLERIFLIFSRLHTQEQYPGTGLGLALSKKIVLLHGGSIWASSRPGEGSTLHVWLPSG